MRYQLYITYSIICLLLLTGCGATSSKQIDQSSSSSSELIVQLVEAPEDTQALYAKRCLNCHAIDLSGKMGEPTNLQHVYERLSYEEIADVITNGRELMPAFGERLTEHEINNLAKWLAKQ